MSSVCRLIVREHSFLPVYTKTFAFYQRKCQVCLFADRNARFGPVPTEIVPGGVKSPTPTCRCGPGRESSWYFKLLYILFFSLFKSSLQISKAPDIEHLMAFEVLQ